MKRSCFRLALGGIAAFLWVASALAQPAPPAPPVIAKAFGAPAIVVGATTSLTITISNPNAATPLTGVSFTDTLPAALAFATPSGLAATCGGVAVAATGPPATLSLSGGALAAGASCTVSANVTASTVGTDINSVTVSSTPGGVGNTATASLVVVLPAVIAKAFGAPQIVVGSTTSLTITISNPNVAGSFANVSFTDTLPAGLSFASPSALASTCGGVAVAATGPPATLSTTGGTLAAGASCTVSANVIATTAGTKINTTGSVSSTEGAGNAATASLIVVPNFGLRGSNMIGRGTRAGVITFDPGPADSFKR